nr:unnamed protein product [Digitaria exilis]
MTRRMTPREATPCPGVAWSTTLQEAAARLPMGSQRHGRWAHSGTADGLVGGVGTTGSGIAERNSRT